LLLTLGRRMIMSHGLQPGITGTRTSYIQVRCSLEIRWSNLIAVPSALLFIGGDDLKMKLWDTRVGFNQPIVVNKRFGYSR
jgi:hypothetical protein